MVWFYLVLLNKQVELWSDVILVLVITTLFMPIKLG